MDLRLDIDPFTPILADQINGQPMIYALSASPWMLVVLQVGPEPYPHPHRGASGPLNRQFMGLTHSFVLAAPRSILMPPLI